MFQYAATVALSYEGAKWNPERVSNIKPFINKHNGKKISYPKHLRKVIKQLLLIFCIVKKKRYVRLISQNLIRILNKK